MNKYTFYGTDASNEISLLEYGLLVSNETNEDGSGTHFIVYRQGDNFGNGHISEIEVDSLLSGKGWITPENLERFYTYVGDTRENYLPNTLAIKLSDLISYFGTDNIMGADYAPISEDEATKLYLQ